MTACAAAPPRSTPLETPQRFEVLYRENGTRSRDVIPAGVDKVWSLLPDIYRQVGFPAAAVGGDGERVMSTPHLEIMGQPLYKGEKTSEYIDCGRTTNGGQRADDYHLTFVVMTRLTATPDGHTVVETLVDGHARNQRSNSNSVPCFGRGKLEKQIADAIRRRLGV